MGGINEVWDGRDPDRRNGRATPPSPSALAHGSGSASGSVGVGRAGGVPALMPSSGMLPSITILTPGASSERDPISRLSFASSSRTCRGAVPRQNDVGLLWLRSIPRDSGTRRGTEAIGSGTCKTDLGLRRMEAGRENGAGRGVRVSVSAGGLMLRDGRIDDGVHRLREATRPSPPPALRRASRLARPCRAKDGFVRGDSTEVCGQSATQVPLAENDDVVETLAPHRADEPLRERVLPRALGSVSTSRIPMPFTRCRNA